MLYKATFRFCSTVAQTVLDSAAKPLRTLKQKSVHVRDHHFIDYCPVTAVGGNGGDGCIAFLRLWKNPLGGPCGGDGGNGGHVILEANSTTKSLSDIPSVLRAQNGVKGQGKSMHGSCGEHLCIKVPVGTIIKKDFEVIHELLEDGSKFIVARGGAGGHGNQFFLSNKNRHPEVAEVGGIGESNKYILELKILAHVGLIGFPNAGKSTFLRAISRARPKIASYPFTTLNPHIGVVHYDDFVQLTVADLPGLIPDAHKNRGLGISFLKHVERCVCLLYVIDLSYENPVRQLECLQYELEQYKENLSKRPCAIVANKMDLESAQANLESLEASVQLPIYPISAKRGNNVRELLNYIRLMYDNHNKGSLVW